MNKKTRKLLTWCLVFSMILTQMLFTNVAFASDRHSGADRYQTALAVVKDGWTTAETVVIARGDGDDLADALAAAPLAYAKGKAPILLTAPDKLPEGLLDTLTTLGVKNVYIVGGTSAVNADVEKALADKVGAANVKRVSGTSRVDTALAVAKEAFPTAPAGVVLAGAYANADALSVSSIAAAKGMPILLVAGEMTADVAAYVSGKTVYAVGGNKVLSDAVVAAAKADRLSGDNRYATNAAILGEFELDYSKIFLAKGEDGNMVDALAGSALAALTNSPIVLVDGSNSVSAAKEVLSKNIKDASEVVVLGGTMALPDSVAAAVENLKPSTPAELAVESVTADNLKEVVVAFNKAIDDDDLVDEVEDEKNYSIKDNKDHKVSDVIESVSLDSDKKVATITLKDNTDFTSKLDNQEDYTLVIDEDILGKEYAAEFTPDDTDLPVAESAKVIGIDTVKVTFSEPLKPNSKDGDDLLLNKKSFEVNNGDMSIKEVVLVGDNKEANVVLYSDLEDKQELTLKVKAESEDYAGYTTKAASFNLTVAEDTEKPYVTEFKDASRTGVTLVFNEDVKESASKIVDDKLIYHTNTKNPIKSYKISGNELELTWDEEDKLPAGTAYVYIDAETVQDFWENENDDISVKISIDEDNTKPTVKSIEQGDNTSEGYTTIKVTYSEEVKGGSTVDESAENKSNYTVKDEDGDVQKIKEVKLNSDKDVATITMRSTLGAGEYTVDIEAVEDIEGNSMEKYSGKVTVDDKDQLDWSDVVVSLYNAGTEDQKIVVDYNEEMTVGDNKYAVDDLDKYMLVATAKVTDTDKKIVSGTKYTWKVADFFDADIDTISGNEKVEISIPYDSDEVPDAKDLKNDYDNMKLVIARVADKEENVTDDLTSPELTISSTTVVSYDDAPEATDRDVIEFSFKDKLDVDTDDFEVWASSDTAATFTTATATKLDVAKKKVDTNGDDNSTVKLTLDEKLDYNAKTVTTGLNVFVVIKAKPESENADGAKIDSVVKMVTDGITPAIAEKDLDGDDVDDVVATTTKVSGANTARIVITMTEDIESDTVSKVTFGAEDYTVSKVYVTSTANGTTAADGKYIVIELTGLKDDVIDTDFGIDQNAPFEDVNGNEVKELSTDVNWAN